MKLTRLVVIKTKKECAIEFTLSLLKKLGFPPPRGLDTHKMYADIVDVSDIANISFDHQHAQLGVIERTYMDATLADTAARTACHVAAWRKSAIKGNALTLFVEDTAVFNDLPGIDLSSVVTDFDVCFIDNTFKFDGNADTIPAKVGISTPTGKGFAGAYYVKGVSLGRLINHFSPIACSLTDFAQYAFKDYNVRAMEAYRNAYGWSHGDSMPRRDILCRVWHNAFISMTQEIYHRDIYLRDMPKPGSTLWSDYDGPPTGQKSDVVVEELPPVEYE